MIDQTTDQKTSTESATFVVPTGIQHSLSKLLEIIPDLSSCELHERSGSGVWSDLTVPKDQLHHLVVALLGYMTMKQAIEYGLPKDSANLSAAAVIRENVSSQVKERIEEMIKQRQHPPKQGGV